MYLLNLSWVGPTALDQLEILHSVLDYKKLFFNASYANYDLCLMGKFKLIPDSAEGINSLEKDYKKMVDAGMFQDEPTQFSTILEALKNLEEKINVSITN